jgi:hypothetical protein
MYSRYYFYRHNETNHLVTSCQYFISPRLSQCVYNDPYGFSRMPIGWYCLPRLQDMTGSSQCKNKGTLQAIFKILTYLWHTYLLIVGIDTGDLILKYLKKIFFPKLGSIFSIVSFFYHIFVFHSIFGRK